MIKTDHHSKKDLSKVVEIDLIRTDRNKMPGETGVLNNKEHHNNKGLHSKEVTDLKKEGRNRAVNKTNHQMINCIGKH
jgi:hypothetical protein